ncbi:hypothetical protein KIN20_001854 [Parelaphostrongylus tenuis]|uniref:Uncharacterized protein n=1 Tax=Parelaphostrongylus tenuis TaxID=148309 RepID=A0AAD5MDF2_PARTN|nr:hypothetical protein KIN20_001854 [Parelaphostrongylus tenuis]
MLALTCGACDADEMGESAEICCDTNMCNTIAFYQLNSPATYFTQYLGHCLILIIIIAKLLNFTDFTIEPKLSLAEANDVIEQISSSNGSVTYTSLQSVKMRAVSLIMALLQHSKQQCYRD